MITCFREWPSSSAALPRPADDEAAFEARLPPGSRRWYSSGRAALLDGLRGAGLQAGDAILLPAYIAAGVIEPARALGLRVEFYRTAEELLLDEDALVAALDRAPRPRAVVVLHPMGRAQTLGRLAAECRARGVYLVEDCAQGLFGRRPDGELLGARGDAALFSLPKFLGTADGAVLVSRGPLAPKTPAPDRRPLRVRAAGAWHKAHLLANRALHSSSSPALDSALLDLSGRLHERYYALAGGDFEPSAPAASTMAAVRTVDPERVAARRRANVERLYAGLKSRALRLVYPSDAPGWVPMAVPAFAEDREKAQAAARARGLLLASLRHRWDQVPAGREAEFAAEKRYLERHVLIPVNEHIGPERMDEVVRVLNSI